MKLNKILMVLAATAMVGCSSDDLNDFSAKQAPEDSRLIQLDPNFAIAGVGESDASTRTHWDQDAPGKALKNKFLPILSLASNAGDYLAQDVYTDPIHYPVEAVGLCWLGQTPGKKVYTNYQFYHFGWLKAGETDAIVECDDLTNGAWYDEIQFVAGGDAAGDEADETDFDFAAAQYITGDPVNKDFAIGDLNYNSGVYKTDNKAIFGGDYIVYYPFNEDFNEVGTIPAKAVTSFTDVATELDDPDLGAATFRYSAPVTIKGGDQANGFGLFNLSALVQLKVKGVSDGTIDQIVLWSKKEQLLESANLAADQIVAGKKGQELYDTKVGTKTIVATLTTPKAATLTTDVNAYITALPTKVEDLVVYVHRTDGTWAKKTIGSTEFKPNSGKLVTVNVIGDDFKDEYIAVDWKSLKQALVDAAGTTATIEVIGDITVGENYYINEPNITIKGDKIIVPEDITLTLRTKMESDVRVLGKSCCDGTWGGRLWINGGTVGNITMEPTEATPTDEATYFQYNPYVAYDNEASTVAAGKTFDAQAGKVEVFTAVAHKGNIKIAEDVKLTVYPAGDLNFMGSTVVNDGTIEVMKDAKFDITDKDGNASAKDGKNMTNNGTFIHNVDAQVGTAVQLMNQNGEYRCRVDKQIKLDDAYQKWLACSVIEMVGAGQVYDLGVAEKNIDYKHNGKYIDIEVNTTSVTTFSNPDPDLDGDGDDLNIQVGNLTVMQGGLYVPFVTGEAKRELTVNGDMTADGYNISLWSSKKITVKENLIVNDGAQLKYAGKKQNEEGLAVGKDITVTHAEFLASAVDALNITCANFTLDDGAYAQFGNRSEGDTKNLTVSGTIDVQDATSTFLITPANQEPGTVLATITCTKLLVGGAFPGGKPQVVGE